MIIKRMESGILAANTYFVCDEESKKGFLVDRVDVMIIW